MRARTKSPIPPSHFHPASDFLVRLRERKRKCSKCSESMQSASFEMANLLFALSRDWHVSFFFQIVHFGVFVSQQVDASLVCFVPRITPLIDAPFVVVEQIVKAIFSERRKTIRNSLR